MSGAAGNIVATLKAKIKETADELEKYEGMCEEIRSEHVLQSSMGLSWVLNHHFTCSDLQPVILEYSAVSALCIKSLIYFVLL